MEDIRANPLLDCARLQALTILYFRDMEPLVADYMQSLRNYYFMGSRAQYPLGHLDASRALWTRGFACHKSIRHKPSTCAQRFRSRKTR